MAKREDGMNDFQFFLIHKKRRMPLIGYFMDAVEILRNILTAVKDKKPRLLLKPVMLAFYGCIAVTVAIFILKLKGRYIPLICLPIFLIISLIVEVIYSRFFYRFTLYDADHRVFRSENHPYGNQKTMDEEDEEEVFVRSKNIKTYNGIVLGIDSRGHMVSRREDLEYGNANTFMCGNPGTKKGVTIISRGLQIIKSGRSGVIASTKDDNAAVLAPIAGKAGYLVRFITFRPGELEHSDGVDFLKIVDGSTAMAQTVADCIISNTSPGERKDYWYKGEQHLFYTLLLDHSIKGRTLTDLFRLLYEDLDYIESYLDLLPPEHPAYGPYHIFKGGVQVAKEQVRQGLGFRLSSFMTVDGIQDILAHDDTRFDVMADKPCLYFVIVSDQTPVFKALTTAFFSLLFFALENTAIRNGGEIKPAIEVIIDEAYACGAIPEYGSRTATSRGYGINMATVTQSIPQLQEMYGETGAAAILNNCGIKILVHTDDPATAKYFADLSGTFTAENETKDKDDGKTGSREASVPLYSVSDILNKDISKQLTFITGAKHPMIMLDKQLWYADWPGSRTPFYNEKNGKTYMGHPLLKDFTYTPVAKHTPVWKQRERRRKNREATESLKGKVKKDVVEYVMD